MKFQHACLPIVAMVGACGVPPAEVRQVSFPVSYPASLAPAAARPAVGVAGANDIGRFLAGRPVENGAVLASLQQSPEYAEHRREMEALWRQFAAPRLGRMSGWAGTNVAPVVGRPAVVFYPLGGPDLLHVSAMFGQVPNYVLMGLEPVGGVPPLESMAGGEVLAALPGYRAAMRNQLRVGYFITSEMRTQVSGSGALRGVTPILLGSVALMGGRVEAVTPMSAGGNPAVEVRFRSGNGLQKRCVYVAGDLSNGGLRSGYQEWLARHGRGVSYFKAGSYLMHEGRFSRARALFLNQSDAVLQDDSGLPFAAFDPGRWGLRLFGDYQAPMPLFAAHDQPGLRQAFRENPGAPLPFGSGYHRNPSIAHLILAVRR